ncbi:HAD family hydrolase [Streptomyces syringium]|uniref:HAD family hydrolase n=1 Tax=Streptomyces syringium TaxID=76729 RepID=UPI0037D2AD1B
MHTPRGQGTPQPASTGPHQTQSRLILFDLDNTLVDRSEGLRDWAGDFARERALGVDAVEWLIETDDDGLKPREQFFAEVRERFGIDDSAESLHGDYQRRYPLFMRCPEPVLRGLEHLRASGWRVGVVTNGLTRTQTAVLNHTGLAQHLDGWCISEEAGIRKPDPRIFALAAERCGSDLTASWMCGDSAEADIAGAQLAGMQTTWIRRGHTWPPHLTPPDHMADHIVEALRLVSARLQP